MITLDDLPSAHSLPLKERMIYYCQQCVGLPYITSPCGEGEHGQVSQAPLYRFDGFDCMTFTNTMLACCLSDSKQQFDHWVHVLSYVGAEVDFLSRRHFMSTDWNPLLESLGVLRDVTQEITINEKPCHQISSAYVDRAAWCRHLPLATISASINDAQRQAVLDQLHQRAANLHAEQIEMAYLPLQILLDHPASVLEQLPDVAVVEIMREPAFFLDRVGTQMHVSHVGILVSGRLYHASTDAMAVVALPLSAYFQKMKTHQQVVGLHVHKVLDHERRVLAA